MKNRLTDLNNHLFAQLERLGEENLKGDKLLEEVTRSKAISSIAKDIVATGKIVLEAQKAIWERDINTKDVPKMLQAGGNDGV
jgi:hypothetical protein